MCKVLKITHSESIVLQIRVVTIDSPCRIKFILNEEQYLSQNEAHQEFMLQNSKESFIVLFFAWNTKHLRALRISVIRNHLILKSFFRLPTSIIIIFLIFIIFQLKNVLKLNRTLNSCSRKLSRLSSQDNSKAVKIGSFDESAVRKTFVCLVCDANSIFNSNFY